MNKKQKKILVRIIIAAVMLAVLFFIPVTGILRFVLYFAVYLIIGYDILLKAFRGILNGRIFDENFLMAIATVGAFALAFYEKSGDYIEAISVMLLYQVGELFQSFAVGKSRKNISNLMDIRPDYANIEIDGSLKQVDPDEIKIGNQIIVQPGERVPIDGIVIEGNSSLNTSAITGESIPCDVEIGDNIISGSINMTGTLKIQTTKEFGESTVSKILELVENSSSHKSKSENFISKFARIYTPIVCFSALVLALLPPVISLILGIPAHWESWLYRALIFLVISCPCALVISVPLSFFAGLGGASREGILIKGSNYLETLSKAKYVVFDKTGTLTQGVFEVSEIHNITVSKDELLECTALAECSSSHPISKSIQKAYKANGNDIDRSRVSNIEEISGYGVTAKVDEVSVAAGNSKLMKKLGILFEEYSSLGTVVYIAINGEYAGYIVISDALKSTSKQAVTELKNAGVHNIVMLTGDRKNAAEKVAYELGIDYVKSELLPIDKVNEIENIIKVKPEGSKLVFVGDGINDAPVLTRADVGIAMGAIGSDAAIEAADVVLMDDDPIKIPKAIKISKKCISIVYQNIIFAISVKFVCLILSAFGIANMWLAIFADVGVAIIAILNAVRAMRVVKK